MAKIVINYVDGWPMAEPIPKKEAALLQQLLLPGEKVLGQMIGTFDQAVVVTDHHVCILKTGLMAGQMFGGKSTAFDFKNIVGVEIRTGFAQGEFEILAAGLANNQGNTINSKVKMAESPNGIVFTKTDANHFNAMAAKIREKVGGHSMAPAPTSSPALAPTQTTTHPIIEAIKQLSEMHAAGILTDDEFTNKKAELLSRM